MFAEKMAYGPFSIMLSIPDEASACLHSFLQFRMIWQETAEQFSQSLGLLVLSELHELFLAVSLYHTLTLALPAYLTSVWLS